MSGSGPLLPGVPDPERPAAEILAATAAGTGLPEAVVLDRAIRAWAELVAATEAGEVLWAGRPDADHLDRLTFDTHRGGAPALPSPIPADPDRSNPEGGPAIDNVT